MWNKRKIIIWALTAILVESSLATYSQTNDNHIQNMGKNASEEQSSNSSSTEKSNNVEPQTTLKRSTSAITARFDPKKPLLTNRDIKKVLEVELKNNLLEKKIPEVLNQVNKDNMPLSQMNFAIVMSHYHSLMQNPELPEVTQIHPKWFNIYDEKLSRFSKIILKIENAIGKNAINDYHSGVQEFKRLQEECLIFLKEPPPKISKEQYAALHKANTKQRVLNYEKLMKERRAAELKAIQAKKAKAAKSSSKTSE